MDDGSDHKKAKGAKKCVIKQKLIFKNYKDCLFNNKTVYRSLVNYHLIGLQHIHMEQMK